METTTTTQAITAGQVLARIQDFKHIMGDVILHDHEKIILSISDIPDNTFDLVCQALSLNKYQPSIAVPHSYACVITDFGRIDLNAERKKLTEIFE